MVFILYYSLQTYAISFNTSFWYISGDDGADFVLKVAVDRQLDHGSQLIHLTAQFPSEGNCDNYLLCINYPLLSSY